MGVTYNEIEQLKKILPNDGIKSICELGSQQLHGVTNVHPFPYANELYLKEWGIVDYTCIDINGENGAIDLDLSQSHVFNNEYDLVTDFGTSEHVSNLYHVERNIFNLCKENGYIIRATPKTGSWIGHGYWYKEKEFYSKLANITGLEIIDVGEYAAMGNFKDGWIIYCIMKKTKESIFPSKTKFKELDNYYFNK